MTASDQGPIPTVPLSQQDTQPMEVDEADREARRRDREAAERELRELQQTWAQRPPRAAPEYEEDATVVVDREKLDGWLVRMNEEDRP